MSRKVALNFAISRFVDANDHVERMRLRRGRAAIGDIFVCGKGAPERTALEASSEAGRLNGKERRRVMLCAQVDSGVLFTQTSNHF